MYKDAQLATFQRAIDEAQIGALPENFESFDSDFILDIWLWRQQARYRSAAGRMVMKHRADRSNLQKALEDALQSTARKKNDPNLEAPALLTNDKYIIDGRTTIVEQGPDVESLIWLRACDLARYKYDPMPRQFDELMARGGTCSFVYGMTLVQ